MESRYYDPEVGRFLSSDDIDVVLTLQSDSPNGLNLYAYCLNNPVMMTDSEGMFPQWLGWCFTGLILAGLTVATILTFGAAAPITGIAATLIVGATIGAYVGAGISALSQAITVGSVNPWAVLLDTGMGALSGLIGAAPVNFSLQAANLTIKAGLSGLLAFSGSVGGDLIANENVNWIKAGIMGALGVATTIIGDKFLKPLQHLKIENIIGQSAKAGELIVGNGFRAYSLATSKAILRNALKWNALYWAGASLITSLLLLPFGFWKKGGGN